MVKVLGDIPVSAHTLLVDCLTYTQKNYKFDLINMFQNSMETGST